MKTIAILLATLGFGLGILPAQTVPLYLNYQGTITDGNGTPLGSTGVAPGFTAAPTNRKIIFRIFQAQTGGTLLWSEQQTVTISLGEFSVLLGQGTEAVYNSVTELRPALDTVFSGGGDIIPDGPKRFLEIVVDDGNGIFTTADLPIAPRQRLTTTAYSFRARVADTVKDSAINGPALANGSITTVKLSDGSINSQKIADGTIVNADLADNSVNSAKIADGSVNTADIANGAITATQLDSSIGIWTVSGNHVYRPAGRVGIGKEPTTQLDVQGAILASGAITAGNSLNAGGNIIAGNNITAGNNIIATGAVTAASITTTGNFAAANITADGSMRTRMGVPGSGGSNNNGFAFTGNAASGMFSTAGGQIEFYTNNGERMRVAPNGNIGIGTTNPGVKLDVVGSTDVTMTETPYNGYDFSWPEADRFRTFELNGAQPVGISTYSTWAQRRVDLGGNTLVRMSANVGIRTDAWIATRMGLAVYSDRRIKRDAQESTTANDLATIQQLKVTDYRMVDHADGGTDWRKGFIAQEVEKVIPGAVTRNTEFVPDIFSRAADLDYRPVAKSLLVTLKKDHELKVGDCVRLHIDGNRLELEVSAVPSAREFEVGKCEAAPENVFVYGKQVDDFRTVDYDRIFTTSVGALQELKKEKDAEVLALQEENAALRSRLAALEANEKSRDAKLAAIEKLLSDGKTEVRAVSLTASE